MGSNVYKPVKYNFNANSPSHNSPVNLGNRVRIPLQTQHSEQNTPKPEIKPVTADDKSVNKGNDSEKIMPNPSEMLDISFAPRGWSRDLVLFENKKPAVSKTYHFNYEGKNFAGVVTDSKGRIYLYDKSSDFHRPLKYLHRSGDPYSAYHAGFKEERKNIKLRRNYIDLGTLEILQAALQSSVGGKYTVKINHNDGFVTNWMHATSPNENEKLRYWNGNVTKLNNKSQKNLLTYATPLAFIAPVMMPFVRLTPWTNKRKKMRSLQDSPHIKTPNNKYADSLLEKASS